MAHDPDTESEAELAPADEAALAALAEDETVAKRFEQVLNELRRSVAELSHAAGVMAIGPARIVDILSYDTVLPFHLPLLDVDRTQRMMLTTRRLPDWQTLEALRLRFEPGGVMVDAGAYLGSNAVFFAKFLAASHVHLIEPQNALQSTIRRNLELNGVTEATLHGCLLANEEAVMELGRQRPEVLADTTFVKRARGTIRATALDALNLPPVRLIKLDFQGPKIYALEGARATIERDKPALLMDLGGRDIAEQKAFLEPYGYVFERIGQNDGLFVIE